MERISQAWYKLDTVRYYKFIDSIISQRGCFSNSLNNSYENHHIIPRAFGGEPKNISHKTQHSNLIWLTFEEHFEAHKILAEDNIDNYKVVYAFNMLCNNSKVKNREEYAKLRAAFAEHAANLATGKPSAMKGKHFSDEVRCKVSKLTKQAMARPEVKAKIRAALVGRTPWNKGIPQSVETKEKLSKAHLGRKLSEEHKKHISEGSLGRTISPETRAKISKSQSGLNCKRNKAVICIELNKAFANITMAEEALHISNGNISQVCKGKRQTAGGYHFKYKE